MSAGVNLDDCPLSTDMKESSGASCDIPSVGELECVLYGGKKSCNHVDEVWPNLFLGDMSMAHDRYGLWKLGITHVLNAAHGKMCCQGSHDFYGTTVDYYGVPANDLPTFDLSPYFYPSAHYIHETLNIPNAVTSFQGDFSPDGSYIDIRIFSTALCNLMQSTSSLSPAKIFVHCAVGVSRSASLVLAYLMIYHHLSLMDAIKRVKENRWIFPNRGFLKQLRRLDATLHREKSIE